MRYSVPLAYHFVGQVSILHHCWSHAVFAKVYKKYLVVIHCNHFKHIIVTIVMNYNVIIGYLWQLGARGWVANLMKYLCYRQM